MFFWKRFPVTHIPYLQIHIHHSLSFATTYFVSPLLSFGTPDTSMVLYALFLSSYFHSLPVRNNIWYIPLLEDRYADILQDPDYNQMELDQRDTFLDSTSPHSHRKLFLWSLRVPIAQWLPVLPLIVFHSHCEYPDCPRLLSIHTFDR